MILCVHFILTKGVWEDDVEALVRIYKNTRSMAFVGFRQGSD